VHAEADAEAEALLASQREAAAVLLASQRQAAEALLARRRRFLEEALPEPEGSAEGLELLVAHEAAEDVVTAAEQDATDLLLEGQAAAARILLDARIRVLDARREAMGRNP
jgi:hypothetical protein